jgi:hypothetical protein
VGQEGGVLALLAAAAGEAVPEALLTGLGKALGEWKKRQRIRAQTRLARLTNFLPDDPAAFERLRQARQALDRGDAPEAVVRRLGIKGFAAPAAFRLRPLSRFSQTRPKRTEPPSPCPSCGRNWRRKCRSLPAPARRRPR